MHVTDRSKTVVMLIDWDNLQICHSRDAPGTELDLQALIALAQSYGTLVSARAYAEWNLLSERLAVYKAGIEPVFAPVMRPENSPREGKSLADTVMVADGVDLLWTVAPDVFVLATSDKDMIPLARIAKQRGAAVVVLGSDLTAIPLVEMSNVFITYRQLLRELDRVSELEAPVGRAPARERRLREARRPNTEPYSGGLGTGGGLGNNSGFGGANIGQGGRGGMRVGTGMPAPVAPIAPLTAPIPPRRRITESIIGPVPERVLAAPVALAPTISAVIAPPSLADTLEDAAGLGGDLGLRRRRRRGGRGRRTGLGGVGEGDLSGAEDTAESEDSVPVEADASLPTASTATPASPDDFDNAVLELLASRDRPGTVAPARSASMPSPAPVPAAETTAAPEAPSAAAATASPIEAIPASRKRMVRTSFGSFGPTDRPARPMINVTKRFAAAQPDAAESTVAPVAIVSSAAEPEAASAVTSTDAQTSDMAVTSEGTPITVGATPDPEVAPTVVVDATNVPAITSEAAATDDAAGAVATPTDAEAPANSRTSRTSRSSRGGEGRRTRRPAAAAGAATTTAVEAVAGDGDEASRAPRRRRTRRPGTATETNGGEGNSAAEANATTHSSPAAEASAPTDSSPLAKVSSPAEGSAPSPEASFTPEAGTEAMGNEAGA